MARYGERQRYRLLSSLLVSAVVILSLALAGRANCVFAQDQTVPLYLEVFVNGQPTNKVAAFTRLPDGRFAATRAELEDLRIETGDSGAPEDLILLESVDSLTFMYDEASQQIDIVLDVSAIEHKTYLASGGDGVSSRASATTGAVLNYGLYGSINEEILGYADVYDGMSANLDGRLFGDFGTIESSTILGFAGLDTRRLGTNWSYSFPDTLVSVRAGDFISGGLSWTRPIRMAGFQVHRNFDLRPDLITKPLPSVSGSAAVPSTVDVYVNNIKTYSKDVPSGPFTISQLPVISGSGVTRVVVRDATGRETISETPFYSSNDLLREGVLDYSAEVGFARLNYGYLSNDYENSPVGLGSFRYGFNDYLTLAGHTEAGLGVFNGGGGLLTQVGLLGTAELGVSVSSYDGSVGSQLFAAFRGEYKRITFNARIQRAFDDFTDVAAHAVDFVPQFFSASSIANAAPAKAIDFFSVGVPIDLTGGNLSFSFLHNERAAGDTFDVGSLSYSQKVTENISMHSTGFRDFSADGNTGLYVGVSVSLGDRQSLSSGLSSDSDGVGYTGTYTKTADRKPGSVGWRIQGNGGKNSYQQAGIEYHASKALLRGTIARSNSGVSGSYYVDGAVAMTADGVFLAPRIDDSFAIVDAGAPDVEVRLENRVIGHTDSDGKLLVTGLHAYQKNKITIDPNSLPLNAHIPDTDMEAIPADRSGLSVRFNVDSAPKAALVEFRKADGAFVEAGYTGRLVTTGEEFVVGYDGRGYIQGLGAINSVEIELVEGTCRARFPFAPDRASQVFIEGVVCQ